MNEKYLYFRTTAVLADDQSATDSACFPLSSYLGMYPGDGGDNPGTDEDRIVMHFKSMKNFDGAVDAAGSDVIKTDYVEIDIVTDNTARETMEDIINTFASSRKGMLTICDDLTGEKCSPLIEGLTEIKVHAAIN
jgi:hypothetical protein